MSGHAQGTEGGPAAVPWSRSGRSCRRGCTRRRLRGARLAADLFRAATAHVASNGRREATQLSRYRRGRRGYGRIAGHPRYFSLAYEHDSSRAARLVERAIEGEHSKTNCVMKSGAELLAAICVRIREHLTFRLAADPTLVS